jgi:hypothetical protein
MSEAISVVTVGVNARDSVATVTPSVLVVAPGSRVQVQLEQELRGRATLKVLGIGGQEIPGEPSRGTSFDPTQTGDYYVIVTMNNPGKVAAVMVIIIDP